jgi:hypothetical protein
MRDRIEDVVARLYQDRILGNHFYEELGIRRDILCDWHLVSERAIDGLLFHNRIFSYRTSIKSDYRFAYSFEAAIELVKKYWDHRFLPIDYTGKDEEPWIK